MVNAVVDEHRDGTALPKAFRLKEAYVNDPKRMEQVLDTFPMSSVLKKVQLPTRRVCFGRGVFVRVRVRVALQRVTHTVRVHSPTGGKYYSRTCPTCTAWPPYGILRIPEKNFPTTTTHVLILRCPQHEPKRVECRASDRCNPWGLPSAASFTAA